MTPIILAICVMLLRWRFRRWITPMSLLSVWWLGWLGVAQYGLVGLIPPNEEVSAMVMTMVAATVVGAVAAGFNTPRGIVDSGQVFSANASRWLPYAGLAVVIYHAGIAFRLGAAVAHTRSAEDVRSLALDQVLYAYGRMGGLNVWVHEYLMQGAYLAFILCSGVSVFAGKYKTFSLGILTAIAVSLATYGRAPLYTLGLLAVSVQSWLPSVDARRRINTAAAGCILAVVILAALMGSWLTAQRSGRSSTLGGLCESFVIYHTVGFTIMSQELENESSMVNTTYTWGRSILGGVDEVFVRVLLNRFVKTVSPQNEENAMYRDVPVIVGDGESRLNAFYTVLHSLYLDGRWLAVFLGPFCFGVALGYWYLAFLRTGQEYALVWLQFLSYIGFFSLFQSPCEEARTFTAILFVFLLSRFSLPARDIVLRRLNGARYNDRGG